MATNGGGAKAKRKKGVWSYTVSQKHSHIHSYTLGSYQELILGFPAPSKRGHTRNCLVSHRIFFIHCSWEPRKDFVDVDERKLNLDLYNTLVDLDFCYLGYRVCVPCGICRSCLDEWVCKYTCVCLVWQWYQTPHIVVLQLVSCLCAVHPTIPTHCSMWSQDSI